MAANLLRVVCARWYLNWCSKILNLEFLNLECTIFLCPDLSSDLGENSLTNKIPAGVLSLPSITTM